MTFSQSSSDNRFESLCTIQEKLDLLDPISVIFFKSALVQEIKPNSKEFEDFFLTLFDSFMHKWRYLGPFAYFCLLFPKKFNEHVSTQCKKNIQKQKNRWLLSKCTLDLLMYGDFNARQHHFQWLEAKFTCVFAQEVHQSTIWLSEKFLLVGRKSLITAAKKNSHLILFWCMATSIFLFSVIYAMVSGSFTLGQLIQAWIGLIK